MTTVRIPRHAPGVVLHQDETTSRLLAAATGAIVTLDALALALWEMCDGETTVQEMTSASVALFDAPQDTVERDITRVLAALEEQLMLEWISAPDSTEASGPPASDKADA